MVKQLRWPLALAAVLVSGCSLFRWSGNPEMDIASVDTWSAADLAASASPARAQRSVDGIPRGPLPATLYYADLGPDAIDVSNYPAQQRHNYALFKQECSRCHTLARAVNSRVESRLYWHFHLVRMNLHSRLRQERPIPSDQAKDILDFLEYDAQARKVQDRAHFDAQVEELKRRFDPILNHLIQQMQENKQPVVSPYGQPR